MEHLGLAYWHNKSLEKNAMSEPSLALMASLPNFAQASQHSLHRALARFDRTALLAKVTKDLPQLFYGYFVLYLDARGGFTLSAIQDLCAELGLTSAGRAQAMMIHMRLIGFITPNPEKTDRRAKPYVPMPAMADAYREIMAGELEAYAMIEPQAAGLASRLSEPAFFKHYILALGEGLSDLVKRNSPNPVGHFADRNAGLGILYNMVGAGVEDDAFPPEGPVPASVASLAKLCAVSRSHVLKLLRDAEKLGYLRRLPDERSVVLEEPLRASYIQYQAAMFIGVAICAQRALIALGETA